jgi:hypothetical protein
MRRGTEIPNVQIEVLDDNGEAADLAANYIEMELILSDCYGQPQAKYISPFTDQEGYHELRVANDNYLEFDIHSEESEGFRLGDLFAHIRLTQPTSAEFPEGANLLLDRILLDKVAP